MPRPKKHIVMPRLVRGTPTRTAAVPHPHRRRPPTVMAGAGRPSTPSTAPRHFPLVPQRPRDPASLRRNPSRLRRRPHQPHVRAQKNVVMPRLVRGTHSATDPAGIPHPSTPSTARPPQPSLPDLDALSIAAPPNNAPSSMKAPGPGLTGRPRGFQHDHRPKKPHPRRHWSDSCPQTHNESG